MAEKTITGDAQAKDFPYAFTTVAELHKALGAPETLAEINKWLARSESTYSMVIENSIAGNTTRSLSTKVNGKHTVAPKQIFRDWAHPFLDKNGMRILEFSQEFQARQLVDEGTQELSQVWLARTGGIELGYGRSAKLVNLLLKHFICLESISSSDRHRVYKLLDIPLDKYSIGGIRLLAPKIRIRKGSAMGFVKNFSTYKALQIAIRQLCGPNHCPMDYEILAYNIGRTVDTLVETKAST